MLSYLQVDFQYHLQHFEDIHLLQQIRTLISVTH